VAIFSSAAFSVTLKSPQSASWPTAPLGSPRGAFFVAAQYAKRPPCKGGWHFALQNDWGIHSAAFYMAVRFLPQLSCITIHKAFQINLPYRRLSGTPVQKLKTPKNHFPIYSRKKASY